MFFEDELGIHPAEWLRHPRIDATLAINAVQIQPWEELAVRQLGLDLSLIRLILASVLALPVGFVHKLVPSTTGRHLYSLLTGIALLYYPFGQQVVLCIIPSILVYLLMVCIPKRAGTLSWLVTFPFLLLCMERTGPLWDTGAVDIMGSLMVLTLKLVAVAHNVSDASADPKRRTSTSAERASLALPQAPNPLHFLSYLFASGNLLAGPFFEYKEYAEFTARTGSWRDVAASSLSGGAARASALQFLTAVGALVVQQTIEARFTSFQLVAPAVWRLSMPARYGIAFLTGIAKRCQYYFIWGMSEAALSASCFGFNGYTDQEKKHAKFDRYTNARIYDVETCSSIALVPQFWNVNTGVFLRRYIYERVGKGFVGLLVTQMVSGLWHGLREGHMAFFFMSAFMFHASKVLFKQEKRLPAALIGTHAWTLLKWFVSHVQLNVFCQPFMLQKFALFWSAWQAFYFVPHLFCFGLCVVGAIVPPPRSRKASTRSTKVVQVKDVAASNEEISIEEASEQVSNGETGENGIGVHNGKEE